FIDTSPLHEFPELTNDRGLIAGIHREIGMLPITQDAEPLKLLTLNRVKLLRIIPAEFADSRSIERLFLVAKLFEHLMFDRQAMAIPPWHIRHLVACHRLRFDDDVFENLVQRVTDMNSAIGIGRAIVQHIQLPASPRLLNPFVQPFLLPQGKEFRLPLRQVRLHREIGFRQIECRLVIHSLSGSPKTLERGWDQGLEYTGMPGEAPVLSFDAGSSKASSSKAAAIEHARRYIPHFVWSVRPLHESWRTEKPLQQFPYPRTPLLR